MFTEFLMLSAASFMVALSGALVPGPVFIVTVSGSLRKGKIAGPLIVLGHLLLEAIIIVTVLAGLDAFLGSYEAHLVIGYLGGAALIVMGATMIKSIPTAKIKIDVKREPVKDFSFHGLVAAGVLSSGSNPQFYIWWLTVGLSTLKYCLSLAGPIGFVAFYLGHSLADLSWYGLISYSIDEGKRVLNPKAVRLLMLGSAIFLVFFGAFFIYQAYTA